MNNSASTPGTEAAARPPVIILGGAANALSVARSLGRRGVEVYALNAPSKNIRHSRYCKWIQLEGDARSPETWESFLLGPESEFLRGAVLLVCNDDGIEIVIRNRQQLAEKFILEEADDDAREQMLDKLATYRLAAEAGVATPRYWQVKSVAEAEALREELRFPLIIKPLISHQFERIYRVKYIRLDCYEQLMEELPQVEEAGIEVVLMEFLPGGDDKLCSYYTYMDEVGEPRFHFTKRIIRRYPTSMGGASAHITDWNPEVMEQGLKLFRHVGLRGLGNVEFKRDMRDGELKLIECNARFTAANCLVAAAGLDLAWFVYDRLTGGNPVLPTHYRRGLRLWSPWEDFQAFRELKQRGELGFGGWIASVAHRQTFPFFSFRDPIPSLVTAWKQVSGVVSRRILRLLGKLPGERSPTVMLAKKVSVLYPGEMGAALGSALAARGCDVFTWVDERSASTRDAAERCGFARLASLEQAVTNADVVISLVPPGDALAQAKRFAAIVSELEEPPLYLDANSVSPDAAREIAACVESAGAACVDGVIVGSAARIGAGTVLVMSGTRAAELERAWRGAFEIRALEGGVGAASSLKMAFSAFNKGLVALFLEAVAAAGQVGQANELLHLFSGFYPGTLDTLERLLPSYPRHAARRVQEMREVESWLGAVGQSSVIARGTRITFEHLTAAGLDRDRKWSSSQVIEEVLQRGALSTADALQHDRDEQP